MYIPEDNSYKKQLEDLGRVQAENEIRKKLILEKAIRSQNPSDIIYANSLINNNQQNPFKQKKIKSYLFDPHFMNESLGFKDSPKGMSYEILRGMSKAPIIKSIITTRVEQVASFSNPQEDANKTGWTIRKKKGIFIKKDDKLTDEDRYEMESLCEFLLNAGTQKNKWHADSFDTFLRKLVPDALTVDQMTFEIVRNRFGKPTEFFATDGATYRLATSYNNEKPREGQQQIDGYFPSYVQLYQGIPSAEFYPWDLCFGMRNMSTEIKNNGYGVSELEDMVKIVTWMLYSDTYNGKFFSQGAAPKGLLKLSGIQNEDKLDEFRAQWKAQVAGVDNAWKTPMVNADQVDWVDLQKTNQDMQFTQWQEYLIRLGCALYKIDPSEIGFYLSNGSGGTTYEASGEYKHKFSKDKGLYPLLKFLQSNINKYIIGPLTDNKYEFAFTGIEENLEDISLDNDIKKLNAGIISWAEVRAKYNLPATISKDDFILNPIYIQLQQMKMGQDPNGQSNQFIDQENGEKPNPFTGESGDDNGMDEQTNAFMQQLEGLKSKVSSNNPFHQSKPGNGADGQSKNTNNPFQKGKKVEDPFMSDLLNFVDQLNLQGK